jgi:ABC-type cobalamin/Fe3+-siderophores transport system ATPase subunit
LLWDNWDDFGYKTTFSVLCRIGGQLVDLGAIRLLIANRSTSRTALDQLLESGWDGTFPTPGLDYISVPSEITFFQQLKGHLGGAVAIKIATALRDASFLVRNLDQTALNLVDTAGFSESLQRERGSVAAYLNGWKILEDQAIAVQNFEFRFQDVFRATSTLALNFASDSHLPHDVNVLIGPNGVGKSRVLHQMVNAWIKPQDEELGFAEQPNLSQVVVVSYSPFERFPVDMEGVKVQDKDVYRYFGFRGRSGDSTDGKPRRIRLSHEFPKANAAQSLIACLADDQKYKAITDWGRKVNTMEEVLRTAFQFDFAAVEVEMSRRVRNFYSNFDEIEGTTSVVVDDSRYIPVASNTVNHVDAGRLIDACYIKSGVSFFKDGLQIELSSGQRLFAYIVINLLGVIRRNSLVLIDEPELFLHPTLEIQFVEMLKEILASFNSKALLATHSEVIVREVPADCVHVFQRTEEGFVVTHPPFQTFGGDIQRISSYVFGDNVVSKPFEKWLAQKFEEFGSAEALIEAIGDNLNEELLVQIKAMGGASQWL